IGDLLAFGIFAAAGYKAYGARALRVTVPLVAVFGAALPALTPLVLGAFTRGSLNVVVPVQTWFGPPAFLLYRWMRKHYGPERTMEEFQASEDAAADAPVPVAMPPVPLPAPAYPRPKRPGPRDAPPAQTAGAQGRAPGPNG